MAMRMASCEEGAIWYVECELTEAVRCEVSSVMAGESTLHTAHRSDTKALIETQSYVFYRLLRQRGDLAHRVASINRQQGEIIN
jgi:hypothetical protein